MNKLAIVVLCVVVLGGCATTGNMTDGTVRIEAVEGRAELRETDGRSVPVRTNQRVWAGVTVETGVQSSVDFQLGDAGGVLKLHPESVLTFEQIGPGSDPSVVAIVNLTKGRVTGDTLGLPDGRKIVVKTPSGVHEIP